MSVFIYLCDTFYSLYNLNKTFIIYFIFNIHCIYTVCTVHIHKSIHILKLQFNVNFKSCLYKGIFFFFIIRKASVYLWSPVCVKLIFTYSTHLSQTCSTGYFTCMQNFTYRRAGVVNHFSKKISVIYLWHLPSYLYSMKPKGLLKCANLFHSFMLS